MGAYLSEPSTSTTCEDQEDDKLKYGASSMQGWRVSQEDAHACILGYDHDTSLFAVFDGHGGAEVAQYTSKYLPKIIKEHELYQKGNIPKALEESFLSIDAELISPKAQEELKILANESPSSDDETEERREEEINELLEDAHRPLDEVLQNYESRAMEPKPISTFKGLPAAIKNEIIARVAGFGKSPKLPKKKSSPSEEGCSSKDLDTEEITPGCSAASSSSSSSSPSTSRARSSNSSDALSNGETKAVNELKKQHSLDLGDEGDLAAVQNSAQSEEKGSEQNKDANVSSDNSSEKKDESKESSGDEPTISKVGDSQSDKEESNTPGDKTASKEDSEGDAKKPQSDDSKPSESSTENDENEPEKKMVKGKKKLPNKPFIYPPPKKALKKSEEPKIYEDFMRDMLEDEEMEDDDEDESFARTKKSYDDSSDEDDEEEEDEDSEEMDEEEEMDDEDDEEAEDEDEIDDEDDPYMMGNTPGYDSGCTAVVALLRGNSLYVANAGDSRCIVCRDGEAIEMSSDHKPEDAPEKERIEKAGGRITEDGRVNGGLNLSRAIGDHTYKQTPSLELKDQMISSFPDIRTLQLEQGKDEFMVLACDGIWNSMSSQEVVDFVRPRIKEGKKLSKICDELFFHCLAPNTDGDGTGCDNMTCIIVKFEKLAPKRKCDDDSTLEDSKESVSISNQVKEEVSNEQPKTNGTPTEEQGQGDEPSKENCTTDAKISTDILETKVKPEVELEEEKQQERKKLKTSDPLSNDSTSVATPTVDVAPTI